MSEIARVEQLLVNEYVSNDFRKRLADCSYAEQIQKLLHSLLGKTSFAQKVAIMVWCIGCPPDEIFYTREDKNSGLVMSSLSKAMPRGILRVNKENYSTELNKLLPQYISNSHLLLKAILADIALRTVNIKFPEVPWEDAMGIKIWGLREPIGALWAPKPGREQQRREVGPYWKTANFPSLGTRLYVFVDKLTENIPQFFNRPWPFVAPEGQK